MKLNKKKIYIISSFILSSVFFFTLFYIDNQCKTRAVTCSNFQEYAWMYSIIFVPIFIFSIFVSFLKESIFSSWEKLTIWWLSLSLIFITILPLDCADFIKICKETFSWFSVFGYIGFSLILLVYKSWKLRGEK